MMNSKHLVIQSLKKQGFVIGMYCLSIYLISTVMLSFVILANSILQTFQLNFEDNFILSLGFIAIGYFLVTILFLLLIYANRMLFASRRQEYGLYRLLGIKHKNLYKLIFSEQLLSIVCSMILALLTSIIIDSIVIKLLRENLAEYLEQLPTLHISIVPIIVIVLLTCIYSAVLSYLIFQRVIKTDIKDMMNTEINLELKKPKNNKPQIIIFNLIITFILNALIVYIFLKQYMQLSIDELLILLILIPFVLYQSYQSIAQLIFNGLPKRIYYYQANSFTTSVIYRKLNSNLKLMTILTVVFAMAIVMIEVGYVKVSTASMNLMTSDLVEVQQETPMNIIYNGDEQTINVPNYSKSFSNYDLVISNSELNNALSNFGLAPIEIAMDESFIITTNPNPYYEANVQDYKFEQAAYYGDGIEVNKNYSQVEMQDLDPLEIIGVMPIELNLTENQQSRVQYRGIEDVNVVVLNDEQQWFTNKNKMRDYINNNLKQLSSFTSYLVAGSFYISQSEANAYLIENGINAEFDLKTGECGALSLDNPEKIASRTEEKCNSVETVAIPLAGLSYNNMSLYVLPDQEIDQMKGQTSVYKSIRYDFKDEEAEVEFLQLDRETYSSVFQDWSIKSMSDYRSMANITLIVAITSVLGFIIILILMTMIGLQVCTDSLELQGEFIKLHKMQMSKHQINRVINQIVILYFVLPLIISMIFASILNVIVIKYINITSSFTSFAKLGLISTDKILAIFIVIMIIYILYILIVNYTYRRIIYSKI